MDIYLLLPIFALAELYTDIRLICITNYLSECFPEVYAGLGFRVGENTFVKSLRMNWRLVYLGNKKILPLNLRLELFLFALWRPVAIFYYLALYVDKSSV